MGSTKIEGAEPVDPLQIESITFSNFKALVNTTLPLGRFTLIVGPNGSGKSTALQGIALLARLMPEADEVSWLQSVMPARDDETRAVLLQSVQTASLSAVSPDDQGLPQLALAWKMEIPAFRSWLCWRRDANRAVEHSDVFGSLVSAGTADRLNSFLSGMRVFSLDASWIAHPVDSNPQAELGPKGQGLAGVITRLRDEVPERFEALNVELQAWLPEFNRILFETMQNGQRGIRLRTEIAGHSIPASQLSQGTLLSLAMLTLAYLPNPPSLIGLEEPDRGIHPWLLRDVRDALYRLAYPEGFGESRPPVQVIATTQSPYFLDLFRDHPEEVVITEKRGLAAEFIPLSSHGHIEEILAEGSLGDIWYTGVLGGVPSQS
jgi:predicted ATPase